MTIGINPTVLLGASGGTAGGLLETLYGLKRPGGGNVPGGDPLLALRLAEKNSARDIARTAERPLVQRDIRAFAAAVAKATTPAEALRNPMVMKVLLTANGLADQIPYTALATKVLLSDPADETSLVNRLASTRWKATVETFQFATKGLELLRTPAVQETLANAYAEVTWRNEIEQTTPGLADALDMRKRAAGFTSAIQILGDPVMRRVVTTALGIPKEIAFQELPAQERAITTRLDLTRLQDPKFVDSLSQRYLLAVQDSARGGTVSPDLDALASRWRSLLI